MRVDFWPEYPTRRSENRSGINAAKFRSAIGIPRDAECALDRLMAGMAGEWAEPPIK
jgi:hypothetical protein